MKTLNLFIVILFFSLTLKSQNNFKWDIIDTISKSKNQLYGDTKVFISKTWKSSKDVIQNDDKESGNIIIKGVNIQKVNHNLSVFNYVYNYTLTFKLKDNKYRLILDDLYCESTYLTGGGKYDVYKIEPFENEYVKGKTSLTIVSIPEKKARDMMVSLKKELNDIIEEYKKVIKITESTDEW